MTSPPPVSEPALVDARFGIVRQLTEDPRRGGMPAGQRQWVAHVSDTTRFPAPPVDRLAFGNSTSPAHARGAALGEAVERYCGNLVPPGLLQASWEQLYSQRKAALDPHDLALFTSAQYEESGFPFVPFGRSLRTLWADGRSLAGETPTLVPASLVYLNLRGAPPTNPIVYAGIATGRSQGAARRSALLEVIERDATAIWWVSDGPSEAIVDGSTVVDTFDDLNLDQRTVHLLSLSNPFDLPVVAAFIDDHRRQTIGFGTACHPSAFDAARKALTEAYGLLEVAADLQDPTSPLWEAVNQDILPPGLFRPWRADRRYRASYRPDYRDLLDLPAVVQLYLDPVMSRVPLDRFRRADATQSFDALDRSAHGDLASLVERCHRAGLDPVGVDVTTEDVRAAGLHVERVVVPGAYSNHPPAFPLLGGERIRSVPHALGWPPPVSSPTGRPPLPLG